MISRCHLAILLTIMVTSGAQEYYITPPDSVDCPSGKLCHTLSDLASNTSIFDGQSNASLLFLPGVYNDTVLKLSNLTALTIAGVTDSLNIEIVLSHVTIFVSNGSEFILRNIGMSLSQLNVSHVPNVTTHNVVLKHSSLSVLTNSVGLISLSESQLVQSEWLVFVGYEEEIGYFDSVNTSAIGFSADNNATIPTILVTDVLVEDLGLILIRTAPSNVSVQIRMYNSTFFGSFGFALTVYQSLMQSDQSVMAEVEHCYFENNTIAVGIYVVQEDNSVSNYARTSLCISQCIFTDDRNLSVIVAGERGSIDMSVLDSLFDNASITTPGHIVFLGIKEQKATSVLLKNVSFVNNDVVQGSFVSLGPANVTFDSCLFENNAGFLSVMYLFETTLIFKGDTLFYNNSGISGGAFYMSESIVRLENGSTVSFVKNKAVFGGAIHVEERSPRILDDIIQTDSLKCFYQIPNEPDQLPQMLFSGNTAQFAGDNIFGTALLDRCTVTPDKGVRSYSVYDEVFKFQNVSLSSVSSAPTRVCACENDVPLCNDLESIFINKSVSPGEVFNVSVMIVGLDFGTVTGEVVTQGFFDNNSMPVSQYSIGENQRTQRIESRTKCTILEYSVLSNVSNFEQVFFFLSTSSVTARTQDFSLFSFGPTELSQSIKDFQELGLIRGNLLFSPVFLTIDLLPCPMGFELSDKHICTCDNELMEFTTRCVTGNGTGRFYRQGTNWIGMVSDTNETFAMYGFCPFGYCFLFESSYELSDPDSQCALYHSGIICGGCQAGRSLAIGSSRCLVCPNNAGIPIAYFLLFAIIGLIMVFLIKLNLDFEVCHGTVIGIIFYANVIWINQSIFFPNIARKIESENFHLYKIYLLLRLFIAWLNLDFGIESCFIYGLDAIRKTWLQFVFPTYIFSLAFLIIIVCHYSTKMTNLFGNNSVSILTTLFLVGYMKIVRAGITSFSFAHIQLYQSHDVVLVWLFDGNVRYSDPWHVLLVLFSIVLLSVLAIITLALIFINYVYKLPFSLSRIQPFFDSIIGNCKDKHRYWPGLTLLVRVFIAVYSVAFQSSNVQSILAVVAVSAFFLGGVVLQVYKRSEISILEFLAISNILIVSVAFLGTDDILNRVVCIVVSVFVTLVTFVGIIILHMIPLAKKLCLFVKHRCTRKPGSESSSTSQGSDIPTEPTTSVVDLANLENNRMSGDPILQFPNFTQLREELLEDNC